MATIFQRQDWYVFISVMLPTCQNGERHREKRWGLIGGFCYQCSLASRTAPEQRHGMINRPQINHSILARRSNNRPSSGFCHHRRITPAYTYVGDVFRTSSMRAPAPDMWLQRHTFDDDDFHNRARRPEFLWLPAFVFVHSSPFCDGSGAGMTTANYSVELVLIWDYNYTRYDLHR